jgi:hypothetical protein
MHMDFGVGSAVANNLDASHSSHQQSEPPRSTSEQLFTTSHHACGEHDMGIGSAKMLVEKRPAAQSSKKTSMIFSTIEEL